MDAADVTGLVGFELKFNGEVLRFALALPVRGLPEDRDAAILRRIVRNREGFLRYLRLLLGGFGAGIDPRKDVDTHSGGKWTFSSGWSAEALFEDMVRALSREPNRLRDVQRVVQRLRGQHGADGEVIPPEFDALWAVFELALGEGR